MAPWMAPSSDPVLLLRFSAAAAAARKKNPFALPHDGVDDEDEDWDEDDEHSGEVPGAAAALVATSRTRRMMPEKDLRWWHTSSWSSTLPLALTLPLPLPSTTMSLGLAKKRDLMYSLDAHRFTTFNRLDQDSFLVAHTLAAAAAAASLSSAASDSAPLFLATGSWCCSCSSLCTSCSRGGRWSGSRLPL
uniref:Uncharacterized protein n=1 Tax=Arundo donax TaxID=35708 RepID=A0A0A9E4K3_ARUDO